MNSFAAAMLLLQSTAVQSDTLPPPSPPPPCMTEAHEAFDFWVGEWDVFPNGSDAKIAESRIERLFEGCAIREHWMPLQGPQGGSTSLVNHNTGRWQQMWIGGNGVRVDFEGGPVDGGMVLTGYWDNFGGPGKSALVRMTYTANEDGSVRQFGEASGDHGKSWQTSFDLLYRPRQAPALKDTQ
ncbi:MAG: hypothetical protein AAF687_07185 [Pseudomonadota bacterium]